MLARVLSRLALLARADAAKDVEILMLVAAENLDMASDQLVRGQPTVARGC